MAGCRGRSEVGQDNGRFLDVGRSEGDPFISETTQFLLHIRTNTRLQGVIEAMHEARITPVGVD